MAFFSDINGIFGENDRIVVGEGDAFAMQGLGGAGDLFRRGLVSQPVELAGFADVPVLAKLASQVAPGRAEGEDTAAGIEMVERFFFDRINAEAAASAVGGEDQPAADVLADKTKPPLAFAQMAIAGA